MSRCLASERFFARFAAADTLRQVEAGTFRLHRLIGWLQAGRRQLLSPIRCRRPP